MKHTLIAIDASAYLALSKHEVGHEVVAQQLLKSNCVMSTVNAAEVFSKLTETGMPLTEARALLQFTGIGIEPFNLEDAELTSALLVQTRKFGLSLGDRACLALGQRLKCPVLTLDLLWGKLDIGVEVIQIR